MRITLYLLRDGAGIAKETLQNHTKYREIPLLPPDDPALTWRLFVQQKPPTQASWVKHMAPILVAPDQLTLLGQSSAAVLLVGAHDRVFALTFGSGYHAIGLASMEPDFGLKVVANSVDPNKLTTAEARGLDKGTKNSVSSLPVPNEVFALGLRTNEEWIRRLGGKVQDISFAANATGADSLRLSVDGFTFASLGHKLRETLDLFESTRYLNSFPFLDYFRRLPTKSPLIPVLNRLVHEQLVQRSDQVGFAAPREFAWHDPDYFLLHAGRRSTGNVSELTPENVYEALDVLNAWSEPMRRVKVDALGSGSDGLDYGTPLGQYVVANVVHDGVSYTLTAGVWFKIDQRYAERLDRFMDAVDDLTDELALPDWDDADLIARGVPGNYGEERYNNFVGESGGYVTLDRKFYRGEVGEQVEICDLLNSKKQLLCVKRMDGSDKMSHLFQQGSVSAKLMFDDSYRAKILEYLGAIGGGAEFGSPSDWTFVFAIATSKEGALRDIMTFFSKVALQTHADAIAGRGGFKVAVAKICKSS